MFGILKLVRLFLCICHMFSSVTEWKLLVLWHFSLIDTSSTYNILSYNIYNFRSILSFYEGIFSPHWFGPLGQISHRAAMSVCLCVCVCGMSIPHVFSVVQIFLEQDNLVSDIIANKCVSRVAPGKASGSATDMGRTRQDSKRQFYLFLPWFYFYNFKFSLRLGVTIYV